MLDLNMLESIIFSRLKGEFSQKIKSKYSDLNFTTQEKSNSNIPDKRKFPNVYVYLVNESEIGSTLEGNEIAGGKYALHITVTNNTGQTAVQEITDEIVRIVKKMRFQLVGDSGYENDEETQWKTLRFRRAIANDDVL